MKCLKILFILLMLGAVSAQSQTLLQKAEGRRSLESVYSTYEPWQSVEMSGKIALRGIGLKPNVKIFMLKGKRVLVSVSAPIVGEVGRVDITTDSIVMINKLKRVYCAERFTDFSSIVPMALNGLQDVLLGRVFDVDAGTLSAATVDAFDVYDAGENHLLVIGSQGNEALGAAYGFSINPDRQLETLMVTLPGDNEAQVDYTYDGGSKGVDVSVAGEKLNFRAELTLGAPKWYAAPFSATVINKRYSKVGVRDFLKAF